MLFKFVISVFGLIACTSAQYHGYPGLHYGSPLIKAVAPVAPVVKYAAPLVKAVELEAPAAYDFSYSVHDDHTGDVKSQTESRKGDVVHGQYSLIDPDGFHRIVDYTSDPHNGFNAVVRREPLGHKVVAPVPVAKVVAPVAHYAPAIAKYAAPIAPIAKVAYAAPAHVSFAAPAYAYHH